MYKPNLLSLHTKRCIETSAPLLLQAAKSNASKSMFGFFRRGSDPTAEAPKASSRGSGAVAPVSEEQPADGVVHGMSPAAQAAVTRTQALARIGGWLSSTAATAGTALGPGCCHLATYAGMPYAPRRHHYETKQIPSLLYIRLDIFEHKHELVSSYISRGILVHFSR